jgi:hypothetical protein
MAHHGMFNDHLTIVHFFLNHQLYGDMWQLKPTFLFVNIN